MSKIKVCPLFSGSSGNSTYVEIGENKILIDAGVSRQRIQKKLALLGVDVKDITAIFLTHTHGDHIRGLEILMKYCNAKLFINDKMRSVVVKKIRPVDISRIVMFGNSIAFSGIKVSSFEVPHDVYCNGLSFSTENDKFVYCTDIGIFSEKLLPVVSGARRILIESNHDETMLEKGSYPYPLKRRILSNFGHLSNNSCAKVCAKLHEMGTNEFILGHLSEENNLPELAYNATNCAIQKSNSTNQYKIYVVGREGMSNILK